jgi:rod shape-determining protein MreD
MMRYASENWFARFMTLVGALMLSVVPLPGAVAPFRPDWVAVLLLYWVLIAPRRLGLLTAFWMGLALDTLSGALLGQHALALLLVVYLSQRFYLRIRVFPASQLVLTAAALLSFYEFLLFWIDGVVGRTVPAIERWAPVISGTVLWIVLIAFVERDRQQAEARM